MLDRLESERRESGRQRAARPRRRSASAIARELHDEVGPGAHRRRARARARGRAAGGRRAARTAREAVRHSLEDVRRIARELRPEVLDDLGLQSALRSLCTAAAAHDGLRVERRARARRRRSSSPEVELVVYRVAQESLTNVMRHAGASQVLRRAAAASTAACAWSCATTAAGCPPIATPPAPASPACASGRCTSAARLTIALGPAGGTEVRLDVPLPEGLRDDRPADDADPARRRPPDRPARPAHGARRRARPDGGRRRPATGRGGGASRSRPRSTWPCSTSRCRA